MEHVRSSRRQKISAVWNTTDEAKNNHKSQSRSVQGASCAHFSQVSNTEHNDSYSIHQVTEEETSRYQKIRPEYLSNIRNPRWVQRDSCEYKQDKHVKNLVFPKKYDTRPPHYKDRKVKSYNDISCRPAASRSKRHGQVKTAMEHTANSTSQEKTNTDGSNEVRPMSYTRLNSLIQKDPDEILLTVRSPRTGFLEIIKSQKITDSMMSCVLIALGKVSKSRLRENVLSFINTVTSQRIFFFNLNMHMVFLQNQSNDAALDELQHLIEFLKIFADSQPATASEIVPALKQMLLTTVENCAQNNSMGNHVKESLNAIIHKTELFAKLRAGKEITWLSAEEKLQLQTPPEDFHEIPILPGEQDVYDYEPFLRPNIVKGKYLNMNHYLDVQFRLLREDFIRPLREGIAEFRILKDKKKARKCKDLRVYLHVHVIGSEFINGTLVHLLQFDAEQFKKVTWEYSKRFLTGSLLCLSTDNFETMFFATVLQRDPRKLTDGLLLIKFEELTDNVLNFNPLTDFVLLETEAYFEAYRHILLALQSITDLPLKKYIVDVEKNVDSPQYLSNCTTYDISPLLLPINMSATDSSNTDNSKPQFPQRTPDYHLQSLPILNYSLWPKEDELGLDASQLKALKVALTKEFSVIQGPPGTGKTFIGLRIVQLLLHNATKWNSSKSPILIVCYTNHALDQFLEGILNFTQKVGRIGGRCNSEKVEPYLLRNLKSKMRAERNIPKHIFASIKEKITQLNDLQRQTEHLMPKRKQIILGEKNLKPYMKSTHYTSLKSILHLQTDPVTCSALNDGHIIYDWLGIRSRGFESGGLAESIFNVDLNGEQEELQISLYSNSQYLDGKMRTDKGWDEEGSKDDESERSSEAEGDIDFIEAMREIDEDFSDIDFHLRETAVEDFSAVDEGDWKTQKGGKRRKKFMQKMLRQTDAMSSTEADKVVDIWKLMLHDRWRLYRFWHDTHFYDSQEKIKKIQKVVLQEYKQLCEMKLAEDLHVLQGLEIVGMTTTGAAKYRTILQTLDPRIVIVEEAAEILESHIITSLAPNTQHIILIGDHQQLRPSPTVYQLAVKYNLNISLFERMIKNNLEPCVLSIQHRMRPSIAALLVPHIYADLRNDESVLKFEDIKGISSNIFFLNHEYFEGKEGDTASKVNSHEAAFLTKFCRYLILQGYLASQITILTAYSGQLILLKKLTKKNPLYTGVRITVVDNFQGEENDIILLSFVRSNEEGQIGFLKTANRVCVALSRARKGLYCIGNFILLAEQSKLWKGILTTLENQNAVGDALELRCQNHPNCSNFVSSPSDFNSVPEGGCTQPCEYRLECGHTCTRMCHPYDPLHQEFRCEKKCGKILCDRGHVCQKQCYQECGKCCIEVPKVVPHCQHEALVPCHLDPYDFLCTFPCSKYLPCGHLCTKSCGGQCSVQCNEKVTVSSPCGHVVNISCHLAKSVQSVLSACLKRCNAELDCDHVCKGTCSKCYQGRLHMPCKNPCRRILVCGHQCTANCAQNCPPCEKRCENRCVHSKCAKKCGLPCNPCKEKCAWRCVHKECTKLCSEPCDRTPCDMPCPKLLRCGHKCVGLCGEPCPKLCGVCDAAQLREVFFGTEDDADARFITLEDCKHVFEVSGLTQWMEMDSDKAGEIQMKCCPRCKTVIRKNLRFSNVIKACLSDVAKVKLVTFGEEKNIEHNKRKLLERIKVEQLSNSLMAPIGNFLKEHNVSIWDVKRCENILNIAVSLREICIEQFDIYAVVHGLSQKHDLLLNVRSGNIDANGLIDCICESASLIDKFLHAGYKTAPFQQLKETTRELQRLRFSVNLWHIFRKTSSKIVSDPGYHNTFSGIVDHLTGIKFLPFTESREGELRKELKILKTKCSFSVLGISDDEKELILSAMDLEVGHWYQCPNGHVYCITECGGAMETGQCNECGAIIGGTQHRILDNNRVATDMDGAEQDAWTLAANLENYNLDDFNDL